MHKIIPKKIRDERGDGDDDSFSDEIEENQWELVCAEGVEGAPQKAESFCQGFLGAPPPVISTLNRKVKKQLKLIQSINQAQTIITNSQMESISLESPTIKTNLENHSTYFSLQSCLQLGIRWSE